MTEDATTLWSDDELNRWKNISDPVVREVFKRGAENRTLKFGYGTKPGSTLHYVFIRYDEHGDPHDEKMTKMQLVGTYGT